MSRLSTRYASDEEAAIDLTPMLDVVFIMLIFFIVTASFVKESGLEVDRPESSQQNVQTENVSILFSVTATDEIWMDNRRIDIRAVRALVERKHAENPEAPVIIQANKEAHNRTMTAIADQARQAGVYAVTVVPTAQ